VESWRWLGQESVGKSAVGKLKEESFSVARRKWREQAETREGFEMERVDSCSRGGERRRTKLDLESSKSLDHHHRPATAGAAPKGLWVSGG